MSGKVPAGSSVLRRAGSGAAARLRPERRLRIVEKKPKTMHILEHLHRNVKTVAMPSAMIVGALP